MGSVVFADLATAEDDDCIPRIVPFTYANVVDDENGVAADVNVTPSVLVSMPPDESDKKNVVFRAKIIDIALLLPSAVVDVCHVAPVSVE